MNVGQERTFGERGMPTVKILPERGVYTLILFLRGEALVGVGRLGLRRFLSGYYAYTGSGVGSGAAGLRHRVSRHLRTDKRNLWHIDFLLAHGCVSVIAVVAAETARNMECEVNRAIGVRAGAEVPVPGFGSSDCGRGCGSHLLFFRERDIVSEVAGLYAEKFGGRSVSLLVSGGSGCKPYASSRTEGQRI